MTLKLYTTRWDCDSSEGRLQGTPHPPQRPPYRACTRHGRLQSLVRLKTRLPLWPKIAAMLMTAKAKQAIIPMGRRAAKDVLC